MLPPFIRINDSEIQTYLNTLCLNKTRTADTTANDITYLKSIKQNSGAENLSAYSITHAEIENIVSDTTKPSTDIIITISRIQLTRENLENLFSGKIPSDNLIDACLKCMKKKNSKLRKKGKIKENIYCLSTKFCKNLFLDKNSQPSRLKKNLLKYSFLIFPIFIGY